MKPKIIALALFAFTATAVAFYPGHQSMGVDTKPHLDSLNNTAPQIEVVFVLDTTGSMGGLIRTAKEKIWSIANTMAQAGPAPEIKMGLIAYRDRGDDYVTRVVDLSHDLDSMYAALMDLQAAGGGDGPESVNQALHEAIHHIAWSPDPRAYKVVFLVGDAPPHMDYQNDTHYPLTLAAAAKKGIVVNAIQCGQNSLTTHKWQQIAQLGGGRYLQVEQAGGAVAITTPSTGNSPNCPKNWTIHDFITAALKKRKNSSGKYERRKNCTGNHPSRPAPAEPHSIPQKAAWRTSLVMVN